jgi:serine/threonine protein kinase
LALLRGQSLANRFDIQAVIEEGPLGAVFRGFDKESGVSVAVKVLRPELLPRLPDGELFLSGCARACRLVHGNLVRHFGADFAGGFPFFTMQLAAGLPLRRIMDARWDEGRAFSAAEVVPIVAQIAAGLEAAGSIFPGHGLLKPENVLVLPDTVKVTDYHLASSVPRPKLLEAERNGGGLGYAAPELAAAGQLSQAADVFSLAMITAELLTGRLPASSEVPELHSLGSLGRLIAEALSPDPARRNATPLGFARALPYALDGLLTSGGVPVAWPRPTVVESSPKAKDPSPASVESSSIEAAVHSFVRSGASASAPAGGGSAPQGAPPPPPPARAKRRLGLVGAVAPATEAPRLPATVAAAPQPKPQRGPVLLWVLAGLALLGVVLNGVMWFAERSRDEERSALLAEIKEERSRLAVERELLEKLRRELTAEGKLAGPRARTP